MYAVEFRTVVTRRRHKRHNSNPGKGGSFKSRLELKDKKKNQKIIMLNRIHYIGLCVCNERMIRLILYVG